MISGTTITFHLLSLIIKEISQTRTSQTNKRTSTTTKTVMVLKANTNISQFDEFLPETHLSKNI